MFSLALEGLRQLFKSQDTAEGLLGNPVTTDSPGGPSFKLHRVGDWEDILKQHHPALILEGPEDLDFSAGGSCIDVSFDVQALIYTLSPTKDGSSAEAIYKNLDLQWRETEQGPRGLLPLLAALSRRGIEIAPGIRLMVQLNGRPVRGMTKLEGTWQAVTMFALRLLIKREKISLPS